MYFGCSRVHSLNSTGPGCVEAELKRYGSLAAELEGYGGSGCIDAKCSGRAPREKWPECKPKAPQLGPGWSRPESFSK